MCAIAPLLAADVFGEMGLYDSAQEALIRSYSVEIKVCVLCFLSVNIAAAVKIAASRERITQDTLPFVVVRFIAYNMKPNNNNNNIAVVDWVLVWPWVLYRALYLSSPCRLRLESDCCARGS
jgi:hypothetical protein